MEGYLLIDEVLPVEMIDGADKALRKIKYGMTEIHNLAGKGSNMVIT